MRITNPDEHAISIEDAKMLEHTRNILERFFADKRNRVPLMEYRRLLIFIKSMAEPRKPEELDTLFESFGLHHNPEYEESITFLLERLHIEIPDFSETKTRVRELWVDQVLREILNVERKIDP